MVRVLGYGRAQFEQFIGKWSQILPRIFGRTESQSRELPRRRVDLYAKVAEVFLDTWERTKRASNTFDETFDIDLDAREFGW